MEPSLSYLTLLGCLLTPWNELEGVSGQQLTPVQGRGRGAKLGYK